MDMLGVDMLTFDSGKCYGPKGVGVLALRHGVTFRHSCMAEGKKVESVRGQKTPHSLLGCAEAFVRAQIHMKSRSEATALLRDFMFESPPKRNPRD